MRADYGHGYPLQLENVEDVYKALCDKGRAAASSVVRAGISSTVIQCSTHGTHWIGGQTLPSVITAIECTKEFLYVIIEAVDKLDAQ